MGDYVETPAPALGEERFAPPAINCVFVWNLPRLRGYGAPQRELPIVLPRPCNDQGVRLGSLACCESVSLSRAQRNGSLQRRSFGFIQLDAGRPDLFVDISFDRECGSICWGCG